MRNSLFLLFICVLVSSLVNIIYNSKRSSSAVLQNKHNADKLFAVDNTNIYRGWAILIIMIGHISACWDWVGFGPLGSIGVATFLLVSGFGLNESFKKNGLKAFWRKKLVRIALPYLLLRTIVMMMSGNCSLYQILGFFDCSGTSYWFVDYIVRCYLFFYIACFLERFKLKWIVLLMLSVYSFFSLSSLCGQQAFSFILGVFLSANLEKVYNLKNKHLIIMFCLFFIIGSSSLLFKHHPSIHSDPESILFLIALLFQNLPLSIAFIIILFFLRKFVGGELILLFGSLSLELYIIHMRLLQLVGDSLWQGVFVIILSALLAFSLRELCKWIQKHILFTTM